MGIGATQSSVSSTYNKIREAMINIAQTSERIISKIDAGNTPYTVLSRDAIPNLKFLREQLPASSNYPALWLQALSDYAATQTLNPSDNWVADYETVRTAVAEAIRACVVSLPTANGKLSIVSMAEDGTQTEEVADDLTAAKNALTALIGAIG
jgi:hypothetical protein